VSRASERPSLLQTKQQKAHRTIVEEVSLRCSSARSTRIQRFQLTSTKLVRPIPVRSTYLVVRVCVLCPMAAIPHFIPAPDVSAMGTAPIVVVGFEEAVETTAYSAVIFGSIVALLTNERIAAGKPGLGFLNPLIYQNPGAFTDIPGGEASLICFHPS
jgi:hypothetical protein